MVAPPGGREKVKRVSLPSHRRDAIVFAIVGSLAIIVTLVVLVVDPHSKWLGWLALLDVALVVLHIPWSKRFMSFRNHKVERGSVLPGDDSLLKWMDQFLVFDQAGVSDDDDQWSIVDRNGSIVKGSDDRWNKPHELLDRSGFERDREHYYQYSLNSRGS
jgi:hypothetical protein